MVAVLFASVGGASFGWASDAPPPFRLADRDGNGFVDREEALRASLELERFDESDRNGDSRLVLWEYRALEGVERPGRQFAERFEQLDEDGNGVLTRDEAGEALKRQWDRVDRNADGALDRGEFAAFEERETTVR